MWSSSLSMLSWVDDTVLGLCARVLKTLCLAVMWWLMSQCKYWSVWGGFSVDCSAEGDVWLDGDESVQEGKWVLLCGFHCELDVWVLVVDVLKTFLAVFCLVDDKGVIYKPEPKGRGWRKEERACTSNSSIKMFAMRGLMGEPITAPWTCS